MSTPDTEEIPSKMAPPPPPPKPEERACILCDTDLGHLPLNQFRAHIEHCLSKPSKAAIPAIPATPEHTNDKQTQTQTQTDLPDSNPDTDTDTDATLTDDELQDRDLPPPYTSTSTPHPNAAAAISTTKFPPLTPPTTFLTALTHPTSRSTRALCAIALNTQSALLAWQDEYLCLESELARLSEHKPHHRPHPRRPLDPLVFEDLKMAALYGFEHDPHESRVGAQDPFARLRTGRVVGGKVLRERKTTAMMMMGPGRGRGQGLGQGGESDDEGVGGRSVRRAGGRLRREGSDETGGSRAVSVVGGGRGSRRRRRRGFHDEETFEAGLSSDAAGPARKRGRPRLHPLAASRLGGLLYGGGDGTTATSEATTEGEPDVEVALHTGLKTEEEGTPPGPAAVPGPGLPPGLPGRLNLLEAKRRGRKLKPAAAVAAAASRLPGLAEEALVGVGGLPPKEKKRKGRPPGVFGKYWGEAAKKLKLKSQRVVDSGGDS